MACAWVTLATNDSYALGALVLGQSLRRVQTKGQLHCLITPGVTEAVRSQLSDVYHSVTVVDVLDSKDEANLALIQRPELGVTFTKLHCWLLTQYTKCVFLDADCLILQNCDELFDYPELSAAPDIGWPDIFNSGVFVFVPSHATFNALMQLAVTQGSFDGGDQGLLNTYFSDWNNKGPSNRLSFIYNMSSHVVYTYIAAYKHFAQNVKIVHFLGSVKPWHHSYDVNTGRLSHRGDSQSHVEHVQMWWQLFATTILPRALPEVSPHIKPGASTRFAEIPANASVQMVEPIRTLTLPSAPGPAPYPATSASTSTETAKSESTTITATTIAAATVNDTAITATTVPAASLSATTVPASRETVARLRRPPSHCLYLPDWLKPVGERALVVRVDPPVHVVHYAPPLHDDCAVCTGRSSYLEPEIAAEHVSESALLVGEPVETQERQFTQTYATNLTSTTELGASSAASEVEKLNLTGTAGEEQGRQAAWEHGNIEYMGRDSWENIQKHLDATLGQK